MGTGRRHRAAESHSTRGQVNEIRGAAVMSSGELTVAFLRGLASQEMIRGIRFIASGGAIARDRRLARSAERRMRSRIPDKNLVSARPMLHVKVTNADPRGRYLPPKRASHLAERRANSGAHDAGNQNDKRVFVDFCAKYALSEYLCAADVFVLPTREDVWDS